MDRWLQPLRDAGLDPFGSLVIWLMWWALLVAYGARRTIDIVQQVVLWQLDRLNGNPQGEAR